MTTHRVKVDFDSETDKLGVFKSGIGWVEVEYADFAREAAREVIYGPIPHDVSLCGPTDRPHHLCDCWCQACEMHNAMAKS